MSQFDVNVEGVKQEAEFYNEADIVDDHIEEFRRKVNAQNEEFNLLLQYYIQHRGKIDVYNQSQFGPSRPNLGTECESWYYLDQRGNKVWVQNMALATKQQNNGKNTGAFDERRFDDGREIVVEVPKAKRNYGLQADYRRKCIEYDAYLDRVRPGSRGGGGNNNMPGSSAGRGGGGRMGDIDAYIANQKRFGQVLKRAVCDADDNNNEYVTRPPATISEAEARLVELKAQEREICSRFCVE